MLNSLVQIAVYVLTHSVVFGSNSNIFTKIMKSYTLLYAFFLTFINSFCQAQSADALLAAVESANLAEIEQILEKGDSDINQIYQNDTRFGSTLLCIAACNGRLEVADILVKKGALLKVEGNYIHDVLKEAVNCGQADVVDWLLNGKIYTIANESYLKNMMYLAIGNDDVSTFDILLNNTPSIQQADGYTELLFSTAINNKVRMFERLTALGADLRAIDDKSGESILHLAASSLDILKILDEKGLDLNALSPRQQTPLHLSQSVDAVKFLLSKNAKLDAVDEYGWTALHYAVLDADLKILNLLLSNGADASLPTQKKLDALQSGLSVPANSTALQIVEIGITFHKDKPDLQAKLNNILQLLK